MPSRSLVALLALTALFGCKTAETPAPAPAPVATKTEPPLAAEPAPAPAPPPPPPKVVLPAAPPLPPMPAGLHTVQDPADNATTPEKAVLGWTLFFDKRLSKDGTLACVSCHVIDKAFTSGTPLDAKVGGAMNKRNSPTVLNLGFHSSWYWDGRMASIEAVSNAAWKGQLGADPATVVAALNAVPVYKAMFERAFDEPATVDNVPKALAAWFRTLNTGNSTWDKAQGTGADEKLMSPEAKAGQKLFSSKGCATCHVPPLFSDFAFHNVGIGDDPGRKDATKDEADTGKFKTPSLRNVALTAPYFHDGHAKTLEEAIALMAKGGNKTAKPDPALKPQKLSAKEAEALKAFLLTLTGDVTWPSEPTLP